MNSHDDQLEDELARATKIIDHQQKKEREELPQAGSSNRAMGSIREEEDTVEMETNSKVQHQQDQSKDRSTTRKGESKDNLVKFTPFDLRSSFRKGAVGEEVTRYSLDKSWLLNNLFTTAYNSGMWPTIAG